MARWAGGHAEPLAPDGFRPGASTCGVRGRPFKARPRSGCKPGASAPARRRCWPTGWPRPQRDCTWSGRARCTSGSPAPLRSGSIASFVVVPMAPGRSSSSAARTESASAFRCRPCVGDLSVGRSRTWSRAIGGDGGWRTTKEVRPPGSPYTAVSPGNCRLFGTDSSPRMPSSRSRSRNSSLSRTLNTYLAMSTESH